MASARSLAAVREEGRALAFPATVLMARSVGCLAAVALVVVAGACGGSEVGGGDASPAPSVSTPTSSTPIATPTPRAETPDPQATPATTSTPASTPTPTPTSPPGPTPPPGHDDPPAEDTPAPEGSEAVQRGPETGEPQSRTGKPPDAPADAATPTRPARGSDAAGGPNVQGQEYTWHDGDHVRRVTLDPGLVVQPSSENTDDDVVIRNDGETSIVERQARHGTSNTQPVFRSESGHLLTLPGGVLLVLDDSWDQARVSQFFADNGISGSDAEGRDWAVNGFFIRTAPGFPSLNLANALAALEGVDISSPNWQQEVALR